MKKIFTILFLLPLFVMAQKQEYTTHTVGPKESLTSIGRLYNINGRELAKLNNIDYDKGLSLGQVLKVPKNAGAVTAPAVTKPVVTKPVVTAPVVKTEPAKTIAKSNETGTPIYHIVAPKETLYGISVKYGKVPIADLKKWNNLTTDGLSEGAKLIVGYNKGAGEVAKTTQPVKTTPAKVTTPVVKDVPVAVKDVPVKAKEPEAEEPTIVTTKTGRNFNGGVFKSVYTAQLKKGDVVDETGTAGVFKSTSGWEDGKYYCLHNSASAGSIMKITNPSTGKSVYAKVLDMVIPDIKQNNGLVIRLSNAAAEELGVTNDKFDCTISYSK